MSGNKQEENANPPTLITLPTSKWRVKVYKFQNKTTWKDSGTGYCWGYISDGCPWIVVQDEVEPDQWILQLRVKGPGSYQKQDTLIIWSQDINGETVDLALSFQDAAGCVHLCEFLIHILTNLDNQISIVAAGPHDTTEVITKSSPLPPLPTKHNLSTVLEVLEETGESLYGRDSLTVYFNQTDFFLLLAAVFETLETGSDDLSSHQRLEALHVLCEIAKDMFSLGEAAFIDTLLEDMFFMPFLGMLEYDKSFGRKKANYRTYFNTSTAFKQVVRIPDRNVVEKIRKTFRLQLLKDVVLARSLDDHLFNILASMIAMSHYEVIVWFQSNQQITSELFGMYDDDLDQTQNKDDGLRFIHNILANCKAFQNQTRPSLYMSMIDSGLLRVVTYGLRRNSHDLKSAALECLKTILDTELHCIEMSQTPLMSALMDIIKHDTLILQIQACEVLKAMLEPPTVKHIESSFYDSCAAKIFCDLPSSSTSLDYDPEVLLDFFSFCIRHHRPYSDKLLSELGMWNVVSGLLTKERRAKLSTAALLACVRCLKFMMKGAYDEDLSNMIESHVLENFLDMTEQMGNVNTLVQSACLDFLKSLDRESKYASLRKWMRANRLSQLERITYIPSIEHILEEEEPVKSNSNNKRLSASANESRSPRRQRLDDEDRETPGPGTPRPKPKRLQNRFSTGQSPKRLISFKNA